MRDAGDIVTDLSYASRHHAPARSEPGDGWVIRRCRWILSAIVFLPCATGLAFLMLLLLGAELSDKIIRWMSGSL